MVRSLNGFKYRGSWYSWWYKLARNAFKHFSLIHRQIDRTYRTLASEHVIYISFSLLDTITLFSGYAAKMQASTANRRIRGPSSKTTEPTANRQSKTTKPIEWVNVNDDADESPSVSDPKPIKKNTKYANVKSRLPNRAALKAAVQSQDEDKRQVT